MLSPASETAITLETTDESRHATADRTPRQDRQILACQRQTAWANSGGLTLNPGIGGKRPAETLVVAGAFQTRSRQILDGDGHGACTA